MDIGTRIKNRRKELDITQDQLARILGYQNKASISLIESNLRDIDIGRLPALAKALDVPVTWLLGVEPEKIYLHEYDPLVKAYQHADKETQLVVRRILGVKKEDLSEYEA